MDVRDDRRRGQVGRHGRPGDRSRSERSASPRRKARGTEPRRRSPRKLGSPARPFSASSPRSRQKTFVSRSATWPRRANRRRVWRASQRRSAPTLPRSFILISSPCATRSAKPSISQFCREVPRCSSIRLRVSSASSRSRRIGERFPLHCTANGKAILACFNKQDATALIDKSVADHPDHPLADRAKLLRELDSVRRKNLAYDLGDHDVGIGAVGAAVLDAYGRPVAVSIPAPTHRFNAEREVDSDSPVRLPRKDESRRRTVGAEERQGISRTPTTRVDRLVSRRTPLARV